MSPTLITILMFGLLILILFAGIPIYLGLGVVSIIFIMALWGTHGLFTIATSAWGGMSDFVLVAVPLFIFMGTILKNSGLADDLYEMMYVWFGRVRGGLAIGTVGICAIFAAMAGISAAATVTMGLIALPAMLKRGYDRHMAIGSIAAGGSLGIVIPPSLIMIVYCSVCDLSVGHFFAAGLFPGLLLAGLFIVYIIVRCLINKDMGPSISKEEIPSLAARLKALSAVILPIFVILMVLGSIWTGVATPTEGAGIGVLGAAVSAAIRGRLTWTNLRGSLDDALRLTGMAIWIVLTGFMFRSMYTASGAIDVVSQLLVAPGNPYITLILTQMILIVFGFFLDPIAMALLAVPIFWPVMELLNINQLWFATLFIMNANMAYITPPVGYNLFFLGSIVPEGTGMGDIYRSAIPFVGLNLIGIILVILFPGIALWFPQAMYG